MKTKLTLLLLACVALLNTSCSNDDDPSFVINNNNKNLEIDEGGGAILVFRTDYEWSITVNDNWFTATPNKGADGSIAVIITAQANTTDSERTGTLTIKTKGVEQIVKITQEFGNAIADLPFDDDQFRAYCINQYDLNKNKAISSVEVKRIAELFIRDSENNGLNLGIKSLKGIEYFFSLKTLKCLGQELESLDVSKNKNLELVDCHNNKIVKATFGSENSKLKTLNLSQNLLTTLDASDCTALETLDVTSNPNLTEIFVKEGQKINVTKDAHTVIKYK